MNKAPIKDGESVKAFDSEGLVVLWHTENIWC